MQTILEAECREVGKSGKCTSFKPGEKNVSRKKV